MLLLLYLCSSNLSAVHYAVYRLEHACCHPGTSHCSTTSGPEGPPSPTQHPVAECPSRGRKEYPPSSGLIGGGLAGLSKNTDARTPTRCCQDHRHPHGAIAG